MLTLVSCSSLQFESKNLLSKRYSEEKRVIFTADDYGISENINRGIEEGIQNGLINHVEAMVTFDNAIDNIVMLQQRFPEVGIGLHLSITSGYPLSSDGDINTLVNDEGEFYSIDRIITRLNKVDLNQLEMELRAQIESLVSRDVNVVSLSSQHNILSIYTPYFNVVEKLSREYNLSIRSPIAASMAYDNFSYAKTKQRGMDLAGKVVRNDPFGAIRYAKYFKVDEMIRNQSFLDTQGVCHPDCLIDAVWGDPTPGNMFNILTNLPDGVSEIVFHLGINEKEEEPEPGIDMSYYLMREYELMLVTSPEMKRWLEDLNIKVVGYEDIRG